MEDNKVLCALVLRLKAESAVVVAKCDRAGQRESLGSPFYGGRDGPTFAVTVKNAISSDPPSIPTSLGTLNFKFVQSLHQQLVYGGDADGVCVAVVTGLSYPPRVASQMLQELYTDFMSKFASDITSVRDSALDNKAKKTLSCVCKKYDDLNSVDQISSLRGQVDVVKSTVQDNIAQQLDSMDTIDSLATKAEDLTADAAVFKNSSKKLRKQMAWKNLKMSLICGGIVVLILIATMVPLIKKYQG